MKPALMVVPLFLAVAAIAYAVFPVGAALQYPADEVRVGKAARRLELLRDGQVLKTYRIALGRSPRGPKERSGDHKTPEGHYSIDSHNYASAFHLALHVSYPNEADKVHARSIGVSPGADIMIHGLPNGMGWLGRFHRLRDWTSGCIAVTDREIEEIARAVKDGTPVEINP